MNRYILDAEDSIRLLPPENGEGGTVEVFCGRTIMFFELEAVEPLCLAHDVNGGDAMRLAGTDALLGTKHELYIPTDRADCEVLLLALQRAAPGLLTGTEMTYVKESCDHKGPKHVHE